RRPHTRPLSTKPPMFGRRHDRVAEHADTAVLVPGHRRMHRPPARRNPAAHPFVSRSPMTMPLDAMRRKKVGYRLLPWMATRTMLELSTADRSAPGHPVLSVGRREVSCRAGAVAKFS